MDSCVNNPKVDPIADRVVKVADRGIELTDEGASTLRSTLLVPVEESSPAAQITAAATPSMNVDMPSSPEVISRVPERFSGANSLTVDEQVNWPKTRSRQLVNIAYFGFFGILLSLLSSRFGGQYFSLGASLCFALAAASCFYLARHRSHVSCNDELPVWARRSLRSIALIFPALIVGAGLWIMPLQTTPSPVTSLPLLSSPSSRLAAELALADKLYHEKDYEGALPHYENVVQIDSKNEHSYDRMADIYLRLDSVENEKSIANADQALKLNPHNVSAASSKAWALNNMERHAEALVIATAAAKEDPTYGEAFASIAEAQRGLHNYAEALKADDVHVRIHNYEGQAYSDRAETLKALGRMDEAKADLERAKKADAEDN